MIIKAVNIFEDLYRPATLRNGNYFYQLQGIDNEQSYNDFLALADKKSKESSEMLILKEFPLTAPNNRVLIESILEQLPLMVIGQYAQEDLLLVEDSKLNQALKEAFDIVLPFALAKERFASESIRDNFIVKLFIWANQYLNGLHLSHTEIPKCIFYGKPKKHEVYFMLLLAITGLDVVSLSPNIEPLLSKIDSEKLAQIIIVGQANSEKTLQERINAGVAIEKITTSAKRATDELEDILYNGTGMFRPWQFADGSTHAVLLDAAYEDVEAFWSAQARMRTGFKVVGKTVYTPVFFTKILGVNRDHDAYFAFVDKLCQAKSVYFTQDVHIAPTIDNQQALYSLAFCLKADKTIDREALKKHEFYNAIQTYRSEMQNFVLDKLDEFFRECEQGYFKFKITDKERIQLIAAILKAPPEILNLLEGYDYPHDIPKVVFYLNGRQIFEKDDALLLGFLNRAGFDLVILSPNGANNIELVIEESFVNVIKLEEFVQDLPLKKQSKAEGKKTLLQRIFGG